MSKRKYDSIEDKKEALRKINEVKFIRNAISKHGDKYDYSKVFYVDVYTKVCIICKEHGEFWITPKRHLYQKEGCPICDGRKTDKKENGYWNYSRCLEIAKTAVSRSDYKNKCATAYRVSIKNGWIDDYVWLTKPEAYNKEWRFENTREESRKYSTFAEFRKNANSAYAAAKRNGWLSDYTWLKHERCDKKQYSRQECYDIAKNFEKLYDFYTYKPSVYKIAKENGWLDDYIWLEKKKIYTYDEIYEIAKQFSYKADFERYNNGKEYNVALSHKWIKDFDWFLDGHKRQGELLRKWTFESCALASKSYSTKKEFRENNNSAYNSAIKNKWIDKFTWLQDNRFDLAKDEIDCVYSYEFIDYHAVYVGRTLVRRKKDRDKEHLYDVKSSVASFAKEHNIPVPHPKYLEDNITVKEGAEKEGYWVEKYRSEGWIILNKAKTGSIGSLCNGKYTYNKCMIISKKYDNFRDFSKNDYVYYRKAVKMGWYIDYVWLKGDIPHKKEYYTYDLCYERAQKYQRFTDFRENETSPYKYAKENGWLDDYYWLEKEHHWTDKEVLELTKQFSKRVDFSKKYPGAYNYALNHSLLDKCTWFVSRQKPNKFWNEETCRNESLKYDNLSDYIKFANGSYKVALRNGWLDGYTWLKRKCPKRKTSKNN